MSIKRCLILCFFLSSSLCADEGFWDSRFQAHVLIGDYRSAAEELSLALELYPRSKILWEDYIQAQALKGDEEAMFKGWKRYTRFFPEEQNNRELIEHMAWGVIQEGMHSSAPMIRTCALLAAFFGNSAKGVNILLEGLQDSNSFIRSVSVELSSHLLDNKLKDAVYTQFQQERDYTVRCGLIRAMGSMKLKQTTPFLMQIISNNASSHEERAAAIESISNMSEALKRPEAEKLVHSPSAGLRQLACQMIGDLREQQHGDLLIYLCRDSSPDVRAVALQSLGLLTLNPIKKERILLVAQEHVHDLDPLCGISAAWLLTLQDPIKGQEAFSAWLNNESKDVRVLAAAALAITGKKGFPLNQIVFNSTKDPFVKLNLAKGLITQNLDNLAACQAIYDTMMESQEQWMIDNKGLFEVLCSSKLRHAGPIPNAPEVMNQLTRLDLLNILATQKYPRAQDALKTFLNQRHWGVTGLAAALLLTEGDDNTVDLIKTLLQEADPNVRMQAALILALWGRDESAIQTLKQGYEDARRDRKEQILEAMGRIRSPLVIPFLIEKMQEPSQSLRLIAAVALIQTING